MRPEDDGEDQKLDEMPVWMLTSWDGSRRETLRRWARLPLERLIAALEEMQELSDMLASSRVDIGGGSSLALQSEVNESYSDYGAEAGVLQVPAREQQP